MHILSYQRILIFIFEPLTNCNVVPLCLTIDMFHNFVFVNFNPFVLPETCRSISIYVYWLKILVHMDWLFGAVININEQQRIW